MSTTLSDENLTIDAYADSYPELILRLNFMVEDYFEIVSEDEED